MKLFYIFLISLWSLTTFSQIDKIHIGNEADQSSAIFQLDAIDKGLLIPRMSSAQRMVIPGLNPGLLVYDYTTDSFWYYSSSSYWQEIDGFSNFNTNKFADADGDTFIEATSVNGVDQIHVEVDGLRKATLNDSQFIMEGGNDLLIGNSLTGAGTKLLFDESKAALRAGSVTSFQWAPINIGLNSFACGVDNIAIGKNAASWGNANTAVGENSVAFGESCVSTNFNSTVWGKDNEVSGIYGIGWGENNVSSFTGTTTWGRYTLASEDLATSWGLFTQANGDYSTAFGEETQANGTGSVAWGNYSFANASNSTAFGFSTFAQSAASTAVGMFPPIYGSSDLPRIFVVGSGLDGSARRSALEVVYPNETRISGSLESVVGNGEMTRFDFVDTLIQNNAIDTSGFQFVYDGTPDLFQLKRIASFAPGPIDIATWTKDGKYGIGRIPLTHILEVEGDASKSTGGNWLANSDKRLKRNIESISDDLALEKVLGMRGVFYKWDDQETGFKRPENKQIGFIAQELAELFPSKVEEDEQGFLMAAYGTYDALYVQGFKAQQSQLNLLSAESRALNTKISKFQAQQESNQELSSELKFKLQSLEKLINQ